MAKRARTLLREQLAHGPKRGKPVEAAAIPERSPIAAADVLGVRTQKEAHLMSLAMRLAVQRLSRIWLE
jgi:hypothetical protein